MKKLRWLYLVLAILVASVSAPTSAKTRGVYVNGQVHFCFLSGQSISHQACNAPDPTTWLLSCETDASLSFSGYRYSLLTWGEGIAVFNDQIFYSFTANNSFSSSAPEHAYVANYDLATKKWVGVKDLGSVHMDNKSQGSNAGAAVTVLNNTLYVFTDSGIYTSGDGISWASHPALLSSNYQPLDAITIYPPDTDPLILVLVGYGGGWGNYYNDLDTELYNGKFGSDLVNHGCGIGLGEIIYGDAALFPGTFAGGNSFAAGAKAPVVQLFANSGASDGPGEVRRAEWTYSAAGGSWNVDPHKLTHYSIDGLVSFPWYDTECYPSSESTLVDHIQRQHLVINYYQCTSSSCKDHAWEGMGFTSDALVPQNKDIAVSCNGWGGTGTDTSTSDDPSDMATLRKYWSLVGVVMGSPPFAVNGLDDYEIEDISNVNYGQEDGTEVSHAQTWENTVMCSAGLQVHAGFFDGLLKIEDQADIGYKHAWETEHEATQTNTVGFEIELGTSRSNPNDLESLGKYGWAIFNIPTVIVQDYAVYAYDYSVNSNTGTYINQDLHSTQVLGDGISVQAYAFELENPGGPNDDVPGLMAGIGPFPKSTDLDDWGSSWEAASGGTWTTVLGNGTAGEPKVNTLRFTNGAGGTVHFTQDSETVDTSGQTTDVDVSDEMGIEVGTKLRGFKVNLSAGYEGTFTTSVTNSTSFGSEVEADLGMKPCESPETGCVGSLTIQPFWLKATDATAPWIPTAYNQQLPWCMAWQITQRTMDEGGQSGLCPPPASTSGKVVGGSGGGQEGGAPEASSDKGSHYSVKGGRLAWVDEMGTVTPIPVTADAFDPALGAAVSINRYSWSSAQAQGKWTRQGQVWKFKTRESVTRDTVTLKLDFASGTWDFDLGKSDLSEAFRASEGRLHLKFTVNDAFVFHCDLDPEVETAWELKLSPAHSDRMELTRYSGSYDPSKAKGEMTLKGTLPEGLDFFGDMSFEVNGRRYDVPLLSHKDFEKALDHKKPLTFDGGGLHLSLDFKQGSWVAKFKEGSMHTLLAPRWGASRVRVRVGGVPWYEGEIPIPNYTSKLKN
jgi:hypothetical protein